MTVTSLVTADELFRLSKDGVRYELVRGELRKMSPTGIAHGRVAARITGSLIIYLELHPIGEVYSNDVGFWLERNPDTVLAPDVAFIRKGRVVDTAKFYEGQPDVAFEVVSPTDRYTDVEEKAAEWLRGGATAVVVVDPARKSARIHRSHETVNVTETISIEEVLPNWRLPLAKLFA
ncbi:MAG TPA: Uma2 family endonuclease [Thermoanaerobaculia bacterium]|nr:Uma2 family endonuclease [Thermoanaerobaculia bacterium]